MEYLMQPWPWYVSGPLIALILVTMLLLGKSLGISSTFRQVCSALGCGKKVDFFNYDWKEKKWNLYFVLGAILGGFISQHFLMEENYHVALADTTIADLKALGIDTFSGLLPMQIFGIHNLGNPFNWVILLVGGFAIGFGSRYAGGCTSGHAISGLSNFQLPSLVAVIGFFIGGLLTTHFLYPLLF
jgi:uncharacterized membrane protein YedE/YeeE